MEFYRLVMVYLDDTKTWKNIMGINKEKNYYQ